MRWSETVDEVIFADFVASTTPDVVPEDIAKECRHLWKTLPSVQRTNKGGWQSTVYVNDDKRIANEYRELIYLNGIVMEFANEYLHTNQLIADTYRVNDSHWWINVNPTDSFNTVHVHGRADVIAVYYPEEHNESLLNILRNDGSAYSHLYTGDHEEYQQKFVVPCIKGRLFLFPGHVWHYVVANPNSKERLSISYNIYLGN